MSEFLQMGGYAAYVWSAYGITLVVLILNIWSVKRLHRQNLERARHGTDSEEPARQATVRQMK